MEKSKNIGKFISTLILSKVNLISVSIEMKHIISHISQNKLSLRDTSVNDTNYWYKFSSYYINENFIKTLLEYNTEVRKLAIVIDNRTQLKKSKDGKHSLFNITFDIINNNTSYKLEEYIFSSNNMIRLATFNIPELKMHKDNHDNRTAKQHIITNELLPF